MNRIGYSCYCEGPYHYRDCPIVSQEWQERHHWRGNMMTYYEEQEESSYYPHSEHFTSPKYNEEYFSDSYYRCDQEPYYHEYVYDEDDYEYSQQVEAEQRQRDLWNSKLDNIMNLMVESKLDSLMNMMKDQKRENELRNKRHEALAKQISQIAEEIAEIKRNREILASGIVTDGDKENKVVDLPELESEGVIHVADTTSLEYEVIKDAQVYPNSSPKSIISTNKFGDESSGAHTKRVKLKDIGQTIKKWLHSNY